jgi:hypothetical protein
MRAGEAATPVAEQLTGCEMKRAAARRATEASHTWVSTRQSQSPSVRPASRIGITNVGMAGSWRPAQRFERAWDTSVNVNI